MLTSDKKTRHAVEISLAAAAVKLLLLSGPMVETTQANRILQLANAANEMLLRSPVGPGITAASLSRLAMDAALPLVTMYTPVMMDVIIIAI